MASSPASDSSNGANARTSTGIRVDIAKINKLHAEVTHLEKESRRKLDSALMAA